MVYKRFHIFLLLILTALTTRAQITWTPYFVTSSDSVTVTFNATLGNGGLAGYTGDVYAHTGVITNLSTSSSDWKYVKTNWGVNTPETKLTRIGTDLYQFKIKPSVRSFYGVPGNEQILKIAFVFRSSAAPYKEGKTAEGGDIFLTLSNSGLNVAVTLPNELPYIMTTSQSVQIEAQSAFSTSLQLYVDGVLVGNSSSTSLSYNYTPTSTGRKWIKAVAGNGTTTKADSIYITVRPPAPVQALPANIIDGINYNNVTSVTLSLYAPGKEFIYVIGDFNNWEIDPAYYMNKTPDGNRWWLTINNLSPGTEYGFQYYVDGTLRVTDPYVEKVLDPWNDKYINSATYPNLKPYPTTKTSQIVGVLQTGQSSYNWQATGYVRPPKEKLVIYEILLRDFSTSHLYKFVSDTLKYLKSLGINAIQLMPVMEFDGNESWGYNPSFFFAPDKYYGTKNDLKALIDKCHMNGIAVILDIVLNHTTGNSPLARLYWDAANNRPASNNPWLNISAPHPYSVFNDFNHESQATKDFVDRVTKFWLTEYKIDGYRFDLSKGFTNFYSGGNVGLWGQYDQSRINILKRMCDKIWQVDPTAYCIMEHFADNSEETVLANYGMMLWGKMNSQYSEAAMGWHDNNKSDFSWISYKNRGWQYPHVIGYMESHDEERLMYKNLQYGNSSGSYNIKNMNIALNRMKLAAAFFLTVPGPKMIWQFGELGYDYSINYPCMTEACRLSNKPPRWDYFSDLRRQKLYKVFAALNNLKQNYPAFSTDNFQIYASGSTKRIVLTHSSMNVIIIGNFDVVTQNINPGFHSTGTWYDFFAGDSISVSNTTAPVTLNAGEFKIYTSVKLPAPEPDILSNTEGEIITSELPEKYELLQNYPNPFNPVTTIEYAIPQSESAGITTLKVYDLIGREVATLVNEYKPAGMHSVIFDASGLPSGIYIYRIQSGNYSMSRKLTLLK